MNCEYEMNRLNMHLAVVGGSDDLVDLDVVSFLSGDLQFSLHVIETDLGVGRDHEAFLVVHSSDQTIGVVNGIKIQPSIVNTVNGPDGISVVLEVSNEVGVLRLAVVGDGLSNLHG